MPKHHPFHIYIDNQIYFLTARIYNDANILSRDDFKTILLENIKTNFKSLSYKFYAFVINDTHYHILFKTSEREEIKKLLNKIHGQTSRIFNQIENKTGRKIWQNYWDWCIRDEKDFFMHLNYIHQNPIKHKIVSDWENLKDYKFCSYGLWLKKKGENWMADCLSLYPVVEAEIRS